MGCAGARAQARDPGLRAGPLLGGGGLRPRLQDPGGLPLVVNGQLAEGEGQGEGFLPAGLQQLGERGVIRLWKTP